MPTKECVICNEEFESYKGIAKVCSETCRKIKKKNYYKSLGNRYKSKKRVVEKTCICCKKVFDAYPNKLKYCSIECNRKQRRLNWEKENPILTRPCEYCKKEFTPKQRDGRFCSQNCAHKNWRSIPMNNLRTNISRHINHVVSKRGMVKPRTTFEMLPFTPQELFADIDSKLKDGMSWENRSDWHIDHIRPVASFNFTTTECEDFKKCWALSNLQPLWATDNMSKGDKWDGIINA